MKKYGCLQAIFKSFYSRDLYRDVVKNWGWGILLYLILLLTICWGLLAIQMQKTINVFYEEYSTRLYPQMPEMIIKNGELKTPEERPYLIKDKDDSIVAIIDTTGQYQTLDKTPAMMLVTKNGILYQSKSKLSRTHTFDPNMNMEIQPVKLGNKLKAIIHWAWILLFPAFLFWALIERIVQAALYSIIGEIFAHISKVPLTYGEIFKISIIALTPAIILRAVFNWFGILVPHLWIVCFILSMTYLWFGILANKKQ